MLHLILADAEIEPIPPELWEERGIRSYAKRRGKEPGRCLLDSNLHHFAMKDLPDFKRRGRPDIVHVSLLVLLGSILNREGHLKVYVHTRNDEVIYVKPETRLPRSYNRFVGLLEKLYEVREDLFLRLRDLSLGQLVEEIKPEYTVVLDPGAALVGETELQQRLKRRTCAIVGAFPHGGFRSTMDFPHERVSIYREPLDAWTVADRVVLLYERAFLPRT
jgi:rRNA small subunit pseudouridine methyltransferase Nep1